MRIRDRPKGLRKLPRPGGIEVGRRLIAHKDLWLHTAHHGVAAGKVAVAEDGGMKALEGVNRLLEHLHHRDAPDILRGLDVYKRQAESIPGGVVIRSHDTRKIGDRFQNIRT